MHTTKHVMEYVNLALAFQKAVRNFDESGYIDQEQCMLGMKFYNMLIEHGADVLYDTIPIRASASPISDYQVMRTCPALRRAVAVAAYSRDFAIAVRRDKNALMTMSMPAVAAICASRDDALVELSKHLHFTSLARIEWPGLLDELMEYAARVNGLPSLAERTEEEKVKLHIDLMMTPEFRLGSESPIAKYLETANVPEAREKLLPVARYTVKRRDDSVAAALLKLEQDLKLV